MLIKSRGVDMIMIPEGLNRVLGRIVEIEAKAAKLASGQVSGLTSFPAVLGHELNESGGGLPELVWILLSLPSMQGQTGFRCMAACRFIPKRNRL